MGDCLSLSLVGLGGLTWCTWRFTQFFWTSALQFAVDMTATASQAEQILDAVAKAAEAASQAAVALREAKEQSRSQRSGFSEASKVVKTPNAFGNANSAEDQAHWLDFSFSFKQWLFYAEPGYEADLKHVEDHLNAPVIYNASAEGVKSMERSKRLYAILSGLLQHRPLKLLKQVPESNGLEVWRQLCTLLPPRTKSSVGIAQCTGPSSIQS